MNAIQSPVQVTATTRLLDKYILPKVALTVITIASFVGTWLTMTTHGAGTWAQVTPRWLHLVSFAFLAGGSMWKGLFARPASQPEQHPYFGRFTSASFALYRRMARVVLPVFVVSAIHDLVRFARWGLMGGLVWFEAALLVAITLTVGFDAIRRPKENPFAERKTARLILAMLLLDAFVQAAFDVTLAQNGQAWPLFVRGLHLSAFGLWFGGAVWNIFIAVPAARNIISIPVVLAASQQLERFRMAVRVILPTLIITGSLQAYPYIGLSLSNLTTSTFGWLIFTKILLVGVLIVVFITCPMWRACSPISGMCKLDDLYKNDLSRKEA
jgi:putative copper resistance protein D